MTLSRKDGRIPIRSSGGGFQRPHGGGAQSGDETWGQDEASTLRAAADNKERSRFDAVAPQRAADEADVDWRDVAMRLKAEMENYRKRQKRWAEEEVRQEKARLLRKFLEVVDNLEYALNHLDPQDPAHQGVQVAYDSILSLLLREGVERIFAEGRPFDPDRHEAVAVVPADSQQAEMLQVVEVTSPGYQYGGQVLRPAKVVVAKREG